MKILVIDNYDSFTYNLVQLIGGLGAEVIVGRNDELTENDIRAISPDRILVSPGPGRPEDSKISLAVIKEFGKYIPVLGVCLGHQAIGICFGGRVIKAEQLMHGKISEVRHSGEGIFRGVSPEFTATRYHSLIIEKSSLPDELEVTAETKDGMIMAVRHRRYPVGGVQFHPESILTTEGNKIISNWMQNEK